MMITSSQNEQIKELRALQQKKQRVKTGMFAAEGEDLVETALASGWQPHVIYCDEVAPAAFLDHPAALVVERQVLDTACALGSGARVIGVFEQRWSEPAGFGLAVFLDAIGDPGNVGTVLRSALAFCDGPVILGPDCADPYSPKAVRASMGALFTRPPARAAIGEIATTKIALDGTAEREIGEIEPTAPTVICVGAEREGLTAATAAAADTSARIAMRPGGPQSVNAAIAASIALYVLGAKLQTSMHAAPTAPGGHEITDATRK